MRFVRIVAGVWVVLLGACQPLAPEAPQPAAPVTGSPNPNTAPAAVTAILDELGLQWLRDGDTIDVFPSPAARSLAPGIAAALTSRGYTVSAFADLLTAVAPSAPTSMIRLPARGWLVLVVDDVGYRMDRIETLLSLGIPIVFSVLPDAPLARSIAKRVTEAGHDLLLHQPMQPIAYPREDPGPRALYLADSSDQWRARLTENLDRFPAVVGINNHMGSRFTQDLTAMTVVAQIAAARGLLLLDSLTTGRSVVRAACRASGAVCLARDVFLDDERTSSAIDAQIESWFHTAEKRGFAVAIAHPGPRTLERLGPAVPAGFSRGLRWVGYHHMRWFAERVTD